MPDGLFPKTNTTTRKSREGRREGTSLNDHLGIMLCNTMRQSTRDRWKGTSLSQYPGGSNSPPHRTENLAATQLEHVASCDGSLSNKLAKTKREKSKLKQARKEKKREGIGSFGEQQRQLEKPDSAGSNAAR